MGRLVGQTVLFNHGMATSLERKSDHVLHPAHLKRLDEYIYADDLVLLTNTSVQAKSLLQNLEQKTRGISLYMNADKTEFMSSKQDEALATLNGKTLKLIDQFIYVGGNIY